ncbi:MAG: hypothetical protein IPP88_03135 [Betaproteobacteria bacterium]|nr:hypothetical protein [Betaproteobacteria bacterium]
MTDYYDNSNWSNKEPNILSPENLEAVRNHLVKVGDIVVLHWHFCGARAPTPLAFDDFAKFETYLKSKVKEGDAIDIWPFPRDAKSTIASGKYPDADGRVPIEGAN